MSRGLRVMAIIAVLFALAGCRVDATIDIAVDADGSGAVTLDVRFDSAASAALDGIVDDVFLADLGAAGWQVDPPAEGADGSVDFRARAEFDDEAGLAQRLDDIAGVGVFTDVQITAVDSFAMRSQRVRVDIDLSRGWDLFADDVVTDALGGEPFGAPIDQLTGGRSLDEIVDVTVIVSATAEPDGSAVTTSWSPRFDDRTTVTAVAEAQAENSTAVLVRWIAWALACLFVLSVVLAALGLWLDRRLVARPAPAVPSGLRSRIPGVAPGPESGAPIASSTVRLVVVEPLGVLTDTNESAAIAALAAARAAGSTVRGDVILAAHGDLVIGRSTVDDFWEAAGLGDDAAARSAKVVAARRLRTGAVDFLAQMKGRGIAVAAVTTDAADWARAMRSALRLHEIDPWLVSSELGSAPPDVGVFERIRRESRVSYRDCLYVDGDVVRLDAARAVGMRTALFAPASSEVGGDHVRVDDLAALASLAR